jgi:hypothetical protein
MYHDVALCFPSHPVRVPDFLIWPSCIYLPYCLFLHIRPSNGNIGKRGLIRCFRLIMREEYAYPRSSNNQHASNNHNRSNCDVYAHGCASVSPPELALLFVLLLVVGRIALGGSMGNTWVDPVVSGYTCDRLNETRSEPFLR